MHKLLLKTGTLIGGLWGLSYRLARRKLHFSNSPNLYYVVPDKSWVTDWVGFYITKGIFQQFNWRSKTTSTPQLLVDHILHYGEVGAFLHSLGSIRNQRNIIISTIFHGDINPEYPLLSQNTQKFLDNQSILKRIVVSCRIMEDRLKSWGVDTDKIVRIPLGVDLNHFKPPTNEQRLNLRRKFGIPKDAICIGSFQKDGVGWEDGMIPKLIKGPDSFLEVIEKLNKDFKIFVLLSGPARGFVKKGLDSLGISYYHTFLPNFLNIIELYACLDLYFITSREEGGPKAILESMAMGIPIVSTQVGMSPDVVRHGHNGFLVDVDDLETLTNYASQMIDNPSLRSEIISNALIEIKKYDWSMIASRYMLQLYSPLLDQIR